MGSRLKLTCGTKTLWDICFWRRDVVCQRHWSWCLNAKRDASGLAPGTPDYFEILQVNRDASQSDIKKKFYRRAKELHPDVNRKVHPDEARRKFQELAEAFQTLSDEELRASHIMMLDLRKSGTFKVETPQKDGHKTWEEDVWDSWDFPTAEEESAPNGPTNFGNLNDIQNQAIRRRDSWMEELRKELDSALAKAYQGPHFDPAKEMRMYPFDFEAEERASPSRHNHVLQIVSGRQLLGFVRERQSMALGPGEVVNRHIACSTTPDAIAGCCDLGESELKVKARKEKQGDPWARKGAPRSLKGRLESPAAEARLEARCTSGADASAVNAGGILATRSEKPAVLELVWMGKVVAAALSQEEEGVASEVNRKDTHGGSIWGRKGCQRGISYTLTVHGNRDAWRQSPCRGGLGEEVGDILESSVIAQVHGPGLLHTRDVSTRTIVRDAEGEISYRVVSMWTPGVYKLAWISAKTGQTECRASRGWLPPSHLWYFAPRAKTHNIGGWYFERGPSKRSNRKVKDDQWEMLGDNSALCENSTLDPCIPILMAAHRTMLREKEEVRETRGTEPHSTFSNMLSSWWPYDVGGKYNGSRWNSERKV
ncbi:unnamed protein product [Choristocarpus tenellus]